jgi:uncharacterized protein YwqG
MTREEAIASIRNSMLSEHIDYLVTLLRPSAKIHLHEPAQVSEADLPRSFFGGLPLLPKGVEWPLWDRRERLQASIDRFEKVIDPAPQNQWMRKTVEKWKQHLNDGPMPLAFLGQVNLEELARSVPLQGWPTGGSLAFFYGDSAIPGNATADQGHCRVIYVPEEAALFLTDYPTALNEELRYPKLHATFHLEWTLPYEPLDEASNPLFRRNPDYRDLLGTLMSWSTPPNQAPHRCAGYPQQIQGPMEHECQLIAERTDWTKYRGFNADQRAQLRKRGEDWQLLIQFASDKRLKWMWSDVGLVYFWARRQDIAELNFDEVLAILQSG